MDEIDVIDYDPGSSTSAIGAGSSFGSLASLFDSFQFGNNNSEAFENYLKFIRENTDYNNSWSAEQAQKQMDFQNLQRQLAQKFNMQEAAKNREWQEYMSSTAHQREVADLKAAGLNPVLSAMGGNGAAVTSGATASTSAPAGAKGDSDQSANMAITSMLSGFLNATMNLQAKQIDAMTALGVADKYTEMERIIEDMKESYGKWEHENYPGNMYEAISALVGLFNDKDPTQTAKDVADTLSGKAKDWLADLSDFFSGDQKSRDDKVKKAYGSGYGPTYFDGESTYEGRSGKF